MDNTPSQQSGKRRRIESSKSGDHESQGNKKELLGINNSKTTDAAKSCTRNVHLWDTTKKGIFFDAVNEFGKDYEKIHNYFNTKIKKVYGNVDTYHVIKIEQVRDFYQNTLKKTCQIVDTKKLHNLILGEGSVDESMIKEYREVLVLLSYWQVMKHSKRMKWPTDKLYCKINEIIFQGSTCLRMKSRNFYVQRMTPKYLVGLKVGRTPPEFTVDILPYNSWSWGVVQNISQNPRIRLKVSSKKSVAEIIKMLLDKWEKAKNSSTLDSLHLCLRAPTSSHYRESGCKMTQDAGGISARKPILSSGGKCTNKQTNNQTNNHTTPSDEHNQILNNLGQEVDVQTNSTEEYGGITIVTCDQPDENLTKLDPNNLSELSSACLQNVQNADSSTDLTDSGLCDVVTDPALIDQNTSITEADLGDIIDSVEPDVEEKAVDVTPPSVKTQFESKRRTFFNSRNKDTDEVSAERERLSALECWDANTSSLLTIGHLYTKFASGSKELHVEYEWRANSGEHIMNSAHNTLALKRLFNLGHTEFQKISKQGKYKDLFITLNMGKWTTILPNCKTVETQTQTDETQPVISKPQMVNVSVQVGKDRLMLPQPTKIGGFIIPASVVPARTPPSTSFNLPKRPLPKKKQAVQRILLPKMDHSNSSSQLVVSRDIDYTASVQPAPFCDATPANNTNINVTPAGSATSVGGTAVVGGVDLCSLIPFPDSVAAPKIHTMFASPDKGRHFGEGLHNEQVVFTACNGYDDVAHWGTTSQDGVPTLNSLVAEHSNHSLPGDSRSTRSSTSRDMSRDDAAQSGSSASILDELAYRT